MLKLVVDMAHGVVHPVDTVDRQADTSLPIITVRVDRRAVRPATVDVDRTVHAAGGAHQAHVAGTAQADRRAVPGSPRSG